MSTIGRGNSLHEVSLDFQRVAIFCQTESGRNTGDVSIDDDSFVDAEGVAQDDVGGLAADSGKRGQGLQRAGTRASVFSHELCGHGADVFGLVAVESGRANYSLEFVLRISRA